MISTRTHPVTHRGRFWNVAGEKPHAVVLPSLYMYGKSLFQKYVPFNKNWLEQPQLHEQQQVTWLGHASFYIRVDQCSILIDPVFGSLPLFPRLFKPVITVENITALDVILISHNHMDHLDVKALQQLAIRFPAAHVVVPQGDGILLKSCGFTNVTELSWWQLITVGTIRFHFLPARHWSGRGLRDRNKSLWGSFCIEALATTIYFGGDTGYWHHFKEIGQAFPAIDLALLPIGPCTPRHFMKDMHLDAHDAVRAFCDLRARTLVPMHWGTFRFGLDQFDTPIEQLKTAWQEMGVRLMGRQLLVSKIGQSISLGGVPYNPIVFDQLPINLI